jgi:Arc/MetJ-type ribon-helix-helix transcriptional regulator
MAEEKVKVELPKSIIEKIKKRIDGTGFESVSSYIAYVLEEILKEMEDDKDDFTDEDEKKVKERLRALGYLD